LEVLRSVTAERAEKVRSLAETALSIVKSAYARHQTGELTEDDAKELAKSELRNLRYDNDEYFSFMTMTAVTSCTGHFPKEREKLL
jgi:signal transduction histidine kinase